MHVECDIIILKRYGGMFILVQSEKIFKESGLLPNDSAGQISLTYKL